MAAGGHVVLASPGAAGGLNGADHSSSGLVVTPDGQEVILQSDATDLVAGFSGTPGFNQVYRRNLAAGLTTLISGRGTTGGDSGVSIAVASRDLQRVAYSTQATNLIVPFTDGNTPGADDVFAWFGVAPTAAGTGTPTTALTAAFDASASADPDGGIVSYAWNFGDGATATGVTAAHTFAGAGAKTARLTVTDADGNTAAADVTVTVVGVTPPVPPVQTLKLGGPARQRIARRRAVVVYAKCSLACTLARRGVIRFGRVPRAAGAAKVPRPIVLRSRGGIAAAAGTRTRVRLRLSKPQAARVRRALRAHRRVRARITVRATTPGLPVLTRVRTVRARR
jgi:hypothetical protein